MKKETAAAGDEYDFASLREKIKNAWGRKEKSADSEEEQKKFGESFDEVQKDATIAWKNRKLNKAASGADASKNKRNLPGHTSGRPGVLLSRKRSAESGLNGWTSGRAVQWVMYEAVFGPPRSRNPWKPVR